MEKQEFLEKITEIGTCDDDVTRRTLLTELQTSVSADYDSISELTTKNSELTAEVDKLQKHNMQLFLQVGAGTDKPNQPDTMTPESKLKFEDLFNEKGGLK